MKHIHYLKMAVAAVLPFLYGLGSAHAQAVVGRPIFFAGNNGFGYLGDVTPITTNGLLLYSLGGQSSLPDSLPSNDPSSTAWGGGATIYQAVGFGWIDLNDLVVNQAATPMPTGKLWISKVLGKDGQQITVGWKLD